MAPEPTPVTVAEQVGRWKDESLSATEALMEAYESLQAQVSRSRRDARHARTDAAVGVVESDVASTVAACQRLLDATIAFRACLPTPVPQLTEALSRVTDELETGARMGMDGLAQLDVDLFNRGMGHLSAANRELGRAAAIGELAEGKASTTSEFGNPKVAIAIIVGFIAFVVLLFTIGIMAS